MVAIFGRLVAIIFTGTLLIGCGKKIQVPGQQKSSSSSPLNVDLTDNDDQTPQSDNNDETETTEPELDEQAFYQEDLQLMEEMGYIVSGCPANVDDFYQKYDAGEFIEDCDYADDDLYELWLQEVYEDDLADADDAGEDISGCPGDYFEFADAVEAGVDIPNCSLDDSVTP